MSDRIPIKSPVGVPGWLILDGRMLRAEFPELPSANHELNLTGIDLGRLADMLLDQQDDEATVERRRKQN